jgi:hypothetical protein
VKTPQEFSQYFLPIRCLSRFSLSAAIVFLIILLTCLLPAQSFADELINRSISLQNDTASVATNYTAMFTTNVSATVGSVEIEFCSNTPFENDSCTAPTGMDDSNAELTYQSGLSDFILNSVAPNEMILSRTPSFVNAPLTQTLTLSDIINPSAAGGYYARIYLYSSDDATGPVIDFGGLAFAISANILISSYVPPYLTFCAGITITGYNCTSANGSYINFGNLSPNFTSKGDSQLLVATNATNGYVIQDYGTTMTSGNNIITAMTNDDASKVGVSQFGINLRSNNIPAVGNDPSGSGNGQPTPAYNLPNQYQFVDNDTIANSPSADNYRKYTVSYVVNISSAQAPGIYANTLTYVCMGSF